MKRAIQNELAPDAEKRAAMSEESEGLTGHLEELRREEIAAVRPWFKPGMHVLDLGGGSGYQARFIASLGCTVMSIDVAERPVPPHQFYPVMNYDGHTIPAADNSFDIIFSSNVLEHIPSLEGIFQEMQRTLKPGGVLIHILPSASWRFWTSVAHFGYAAKFVAGGTRPEAAPGATPPATGAKPTRGLSHRLKQILPLSPHGEYPNSVAELYYFSAARWTRVFRSNGFEIEARTENGIFYTGYDLLPKLSVPKRRRLARGLGSACNIFVLKVAPVTA